MRDIHASGVNAIESMDTAQIPALILCGGTIEARDQAVARLVEPATADRPIAVLRTGFGMLAGAATHFGPHVTLKTAPIGCLCCTAGVMFRVALLGLLRMSKPARLLVDLGPGTHVATLEAQLRGASLARAVRVLERIDLDANAGASAIAWPVELRAPQPQRDN